MASRIPFGCHQRRQDQQRDHLLGCMGCNAPICWDAWAASRVAIVQSLADHDPDVDAIYRLTQHPLPFYFQRTQQQQETADQGVSTVSHIEQEASPHKTREKKNFYTLSQCQRARSCLTTHNQRCTDTPPSGACCSQEQFTAESPIFGVVISNNVYLLWDIVRMRVAFSTPWVSQYRNAHHHLADFNSEVPLNQQSRARSSMRCSHGSLYQRLCQVASKRSISSHIMRRESSVSQMSS